MHLGFLPLQIPYTKRSIHSMRRGSLRSLAQRRNLGKEHFLVVDLATDLAKRLSIKTSFESAKKIDKIFE